MKIEQLLMMILLAFSCAVHAQSDETIELVFENVPVPIGFASAQDPIWDTDRPEFYIYRAHPYYQYALASGNQALWKKVESACDIFFALGNDQCVNLRTIAFKKSLLHCRQEAQQGNGSWCPDKVTTRINYPSGHNSYGTCLHDFQGKETHQIRILLGAGSAGTMYRISSDFNKAVYQVRSGTSLGDEQKDKICSACLLPYAALDGIPQASCTGLWDYLVHQYGAGLYAGFKDWNPARGRQFGNFNMDGAAITCIRGCLNALETTPKGMFNKTSCWQDQSITFGGIKAYIVMNGIDTNQIPFRW